MRFLLTSTLFAFCALSLSPAAAQSGAWFDLKDDEGRPVQNMRAPVELTTEIDRLKGVNAIGAANPDASIIEFMDYNCPFCRKAATDLESLALSIPGVRIKFVQNAITSAQSKEAARVVLAAFRIGGSRIAYQLHERLYARRGVNDAKAALNIGAELGLDAAALEKAAEAAEVGDVMNSHMQLATSLGMAATPSFIIHGMIISGYPGPETMRHMVESIKACDAIAC